VEAKATDQATPSHLKGLRQFREEYPVRRSILVSLDARPRITDDGIEILPWSRFLEKLWGGELL
jgi:predicted AAA+ superfamily ATPase